MQIQVLTNVFQRNDAAADENRAAFDGHGITCINLLGGAGCGKTTVLEGLLPRLRERLSVGVLEGDLATTKDAQRIAALNVPVIQLLTDGGCHLNATLVQQGIARLPMGGLDLLIIENVGNPICPANYDLGEHLRVSVLSVSEGDDKPAKYPLLFKDADAVLLTKCDLLPYVDFDLDAVTREIKRLNPGVIVFRTDQKSRAGIGELAEWIRDRTLGTATAGLKP